jgi:hypothetical protein
MEYEHFSVIAFERQPNKWRARIRRADGMPVVIQGLKKLEEFVTGIDCETAQAALMMGIAAIDAGSSNVAAIRGAGVESRDARAIGASPLLSERCCFSHLRFGG